jgi:hypothetical protein
MSMTEVANDATTHCCMGSDLKEILHTARNTAYSYAIDVMDDCVSMNGSQGVIVLERKGCGANKCIKSWYVILMHSFEDDPHETDPTNYHVYQDKVVYIVCVEQVESGVESGAENE